MRALRLSLPARSAPASTSSASAACSGPRRESRPSRTSSSPKRRWMNATPGHEVHMLPRSALDLRIVEGKVLPTWLGAVDEKFVEAVLEILRDLDARAFAEANATAKALLAPLARRVGLSP